MLDVGSGAGIDGITFVREGAEVTFVDIGVQPAGHKTSLQDLSSKGRELPISGESGSLNALESDYDIVWCDGSMVTTPFEIARQED